MRFSQSLIPTLREAPANAEIPSHVLLLRAGLIRQLGSGLFTWLPLGVNVLQKVERVVREELTKRGAYEILMPFVQPAELWKESERWQVMGPELLRLADRHDNEYCLSPTHEEVVTDLFRNNVSSYRQLPCNLFQINTKFRDEIRPRFGVLRSREFIMKDGYSFHLDEETFDATYQAMYDAYAAILTRLDLDFRAVEADPGLIGDGDSHEFHVLANTGEDALAFSQDGDYAANVERAEAITEELRPDSKKDLTKLATPGVTSIESLVDFLEIDIVSTVKTIIVEGKDSPIALVLRGDHELNELKAARLPNVVQPLRFATEEQVLDAVGCKLGSIGPVGLEIPVYVDRAAGVLADFYCGSNETGFHLSGVNWDRDVSCDNNVDIRRVQEGDPAPDGSGPLSIVRGIEVGHIFQLGTKYSRSMQASVQDANGVNVFPLMGCYGIGITRLAAAIVEQRHDEIGIDWPTEASPATLHVLSLNAERSELVRTTSNQIYSDCMNAGIDVLYDDRPERPGVKFADADLIGIPHRVVVGERALNEGKVEYRYRRGETSLVEPSDIVRRLNA
ncbi:MAG: proline--tRNA ligase [Gammaproteobacteria bacterium]|nr:proline--tRNA ligase [Gammaproteobacteria bacterium]